ncbi:FKBP-type peptidyl-prolyl cis-trans isomerase [Candidatus Micrarchaeota archaeon]|nr:FKBP-type peptidyl-prolyl cis-trans isomerase [Candidatus Micrarchaeota archaeon]
MKRFIILIIIGLFFFGCIEKEELFVEKGDKVLVDYITYLENGSIIDTSLQEVAIQNSIYNKNREYSPIEVSILDNNGYIKGLTYGLIDLANGSNETLIIYPEMAYGKYKDEEVFKVETYYTFNLIEELDKSVLNQDFELNEIIQENAWNVTVINITNNTYTFRHEPKINTTFIHMGIPNSIYDLNETHAFVKVNLEEGSTHYFEHPISHTLSVGRVISVNDTLITIDFNQKLAGKIIYMDVWVRNITKRQ